MNAEKRERLYRVMGEAAALPPEDRQRRAVEAEIAAEGSWAEQEWLKLLQEDERLRLELQRVSVPVGMQERLLRIPDGDSRSQTRCFPWWRFAAAAAVIAVIVGAYFLPHGNRDRLRSVALLAMNEHLNRKDLTVVTQDPSQLAGRLSAALPFRVSLPDLGPEFRLVGGSDCKMCTHRAALSLWSRGGEEFSLLQFIPADFKLPPEMEPVTFCCVDMVPAGAPCDVKVWTRNGYGYALITRNCPRSASKAAVALQREKMRSFFVSRYRASG